MTSASAILQASTAGVCHSLLPYVKLNLEGKNKATVASRFREQLLDLVARLDCTEMHFVRCAASSTRLLHGKHNKTRTVCVCMLCVVSRAVASHAPRIPVYNCCLQHHALVWYMLRSVSKADACKHQQSLSMTAAHSSKARQAQSAHAHLLACHTPIIAWQQKSCHQSFRVSAGASSRTTALNPTHSTRR